jgi:NADPH:quinone reductase-like Zn-dependent oxidoreductase
MAIGSGFLEGQPVYYNSWIYRDARGEEQVRTVICAGYGKPEVLQLAEAEEPVPQKSEVRIRIRAAAVTASDCIIRGFKLPRWSPMGFMMGAAVGFTRPRNPILGQALSGEIEASGSKARRFRIGEHVLAFTGMRFGAYAEYICLSEDDAIVQMPPNLSFEEAAAIPYGGLLALYFLQKGNIESAERALVYGGSGAVGTSAIQLAKHFGARVTAICSKSNTELARSLGAEETIDYTKESHLGGMYYDLIFDAVGRKKSSPLKLQCRKHLAPGGRYISVDDKIPARHEPPTKLLTLLRDLASGGELRPVIDRVYILEQMVEAHAYVDEGHKKGNVIVRI